MVVVGVVGHSVVVVGSAVVVVKLGSGIQLKTSYGLKRFATINDVTL